MAASPRNLFIALGLLALAACAGSPAAPSATADADPLAGTRWQLVNIESMDDSVATPDDGGKYTIEFGSDGSVGIKADCNRLAGRYTFSAPSGLEFGALRSTMAFCGGNSLYERLRKDMPFVRSFVIKDGRLHLALMADGGIYHFSPMP